MIHLRNFEEIAQASKVEMRVMKKVIPVIQEHIGIIRKRTHQYKNEYDIKKETTAKLVRVQFT
jgi:hypothetical protein